ncbi:hypothetical protein DFJ74DRAFT_657397 [Hyaloraphidium curvatum]|nr:hypothetical protein DFJ74DRAFT_657397 [Hyaloraphidium curvatum]
MVNAKGGRAASKTPGAGKAQQKKGAESVSKGSGTLDAFLRPQAERARRPPFFSASAGQRPPSAPRTRWNGTAVEILSSDDAPDGGEGGAGQPGDSAIKFDTFSAERPTRDEVVDLLSDPDLSASPAMSAAASLPLPVSFGARTAVDDFEQRGSVVENFPLDDAFPDEAVEPPPCPEGDEDLFAEPWEPPPDEDFVPEGFFDQDVDENAYREAGIGGVDNCEFDDLEFDPADLDDLERQIVGTTPAATDPRVLEALDSTPNRSPADAEQQCPVCSASLQQMKPLVAESHVNRCLDRGSQAEAGPSLKRRRGSNGGAISLSSTPEAEKIEDKSVADARPSNGPPQQRSLMTFFGLGDAEAAEEVPEPLPESRWTPWGSAGGPKRPPPFHKKVPGTGFLVDAFGYGEVEWATGYFLTHYHADHFGGLTKNGKRAPIYCSSVTKNLCMKQLKVPEEKLVTLPFEGELMVPDGPRSMVRVQTIDANHCPGSVLVLFHVQHPGPTTRSYLHTGDFRATPAMLAHPFLLLPHPLDVLFLDTTYAKPDHRFPAQERVIETVCELIRRGVASDGGGVKEVVREELGRLRRETIQGRGAANRSGKGVIGGLLGWFTSVRTVPKAKKAAPEEPERERGTLASCFLPSARPAAPRPSTTLVVCGSYQIGKERLYKALATSLSTLIFADGSKRGLLECQEDAALSALLTNDPTKAAVHVVSMGQVRVDSLLEILAKVKQKGGRFDRVVGIRPTGWTWTAKGRGMPHSAQGGSPNRNFSLHHLRPYQPHQLVTIVDVPYSEHSSFTELEMLVTGLAAGCGVRRCVPTVGGGKEGWREAAGWCDRWVSRGKEAAQQARLRQSAPAPDADDT